MSAKRIFPPLRMALFSCNDPCCSTSIWSLLRSRLLALGRAMALGLLPFFAWYPGVKDGPQWRWEKSELMRAHGHWSMGCPCHTKGHVNISGVEVIIQAFHHLLSGEGWGWQSGCYRSTALGWLMTQPPWGSGIPFRKLLMQRQRLSSPRTTKIFKICYS